MAGTVQRVLELNVGHWNADDRDAWLASWHEDCEWVSAVTSSVDGSRIVYRGHDGLKRFWEDNHEAWEHFKVDVMSVIDLGDGLVLMSGRVRARGRLSGVELDSPLLFVLRFREEQVLRGSAYLDPKSALDALRAEGVAEEIIGAIPAEGLR